MVPRSIAFGSGEARSKSCSLTHLFLQNNSNVSVLPRFFTFLRGPSVRYLMDPSIDYLRCLHLIIYVEAQQFLHAALSPRDIIIKKNEISFSYQIWNFSFWKFCIWMLYRPLFAFSISFIYHFYSHVRLFNSSFVWCPGIHSLIKSDSYCMTHQDIPEREFWVGE